MAEGYHGHKTLPDGTHVAMSRDEAEALWKAIEAASVRRAEAMPTSQDALSTLIDAKHRMNELGWRQGGGLKVRWGDECAVAQTGSTGIWHGLYQPNGAYVLFAGEVSKPRDVWLKPLADLTDAERAHMERCDREAAGTIDPMAAALGSAGGPQPGY